MNTKNKIIKRINLHIKEIKDNPKNGRFFLPVQLSELSGLRRARAIVEAAFREEAVRLELTDRERSLVDQILDFAREYPEGFTLDTRSRKLHEAAAKKHEAVGSKVLCLNEYTISNSEELAVFLNERFRNSTTYDIAEQYVNETILGVGHE